MKRDDVDTLIVQARHPRVKRNSQLTAPSLVGVSRSCMIRNNLPHGATGHDQEVPAIFDRVQLASEFETSLMDDRGGLKRVSFSLTGEDGTRDGAELRVDECEELVEGALISRLELT